MTEPTAMRMRYLADAVSTATPAQLIVMLYDRLQLDLDRAQAELDAQQHPAASTQLRHAVSIISELCGSLDVGAWSGGPDLVTLYGFLITELMEVDRSGDAARLPGCQRIVKALRTSWLQAGAIIAGESALLATAVAPDRLPAAVSAGSWVG